MALELILTERYDGVAVIALNRPEKLNALGFGLIRELNEALIDCKKDEPVKAVTPTSAGERALSVAPTSTRWRGCRARNLRSARGLPQRGDAACRDLSCSRRSIP
jgi:enoyl-CoA hydratase